MNKLISLVNQRFLKIITKLIISLDNFLLANYVKIKLYKLIVTDYIRNSEKECLLEKKYLNTLISQIATFYSSPNFLCNPFLQKYLKTGFLMYQNPYQFSKYLITISKFNIKTYLEIGTFLGGSFVTTVEYLMRFNPKFKYAVGIDEYYYISMANYANLNKKVRYSIMNSQSSFFQDLIRKSPKFDLIFIDSNHSYEYCKRDFEIVKEKANIIALHDILEKEVDVVWNYIKDTYNNEYIFLEFTDQYLKEGRYMGIGLIIRKDFQ